MKKQKKLGMFIGLAGLFLAGQVFAAGSATISWTSPTTDEGGGSLSGLTGYRVYRSSSAIDCTAWNAGDQVYRTANPLSATSVNVSGGSTTSYRFNNNLTAGQIYYFAVVATDGTNLSKCATEVGGATQVSKTVTYSGDLNADNAVNIFDYNLLKLHFGTSNIAGDVDKNGTVNIFDYNMLKSDFGSSF